MNAKGAVTADVMLVSTGSVWKYLDTGTNLGSAWRGLSFNDSAWLSGPAELGYSNNPVTIVGFGPDPNNKYITTYFRRAFSFTNASAFTDLKFRLLRDDGAVVYLNDIEVFRSNMPDGIISNATPASVAVGGTDETTFFPTNVSATALVSGTNILAVEIHQQSGNSTDLGFDLELVAAARELSQPGISVIANQTTVEDTPITIPFSVSDPDTPAWNLIVSGRSTNTALLTAAGFLFEGSGTNRTLTILPAPDQFGTTLITLTVTDGTSSASNSFVLTVTPVNDAPTLNPIPDVGLVAGFANTTISFNGISSGAANESQALTVTAVSSNTALVTINSLAYTSPATNGSLVLRRFSTSATGKAVVSVTVNDGGTSNNLVTRTFTVFVRSSGNSPPIISGASLTNRVTSEDTPTPAIPFTVGDSVTPATLLTLAGDSSNPSLVPINNIIFGGSGSNRTVTITPMPNRFGTATIRISVMDTNFGMASTNFLLTMTPVNDAPVISPIANQIISEDGSTGPIGFTVSDVETSAAGLAVSATSTNQVLVPNGNVIFGGSGTNRFLVVTPATNQFGTSLITVSVNDGTTSASTSFVLTVNPVNDPPTISLIANQVTSEDTASAAIAFTIGDLETAAGSLILAATSSNPALIASYSFGGSGASRTLVILPATNQFGSATVTLTVDDGNGGNASTSFLFSVNPVNDPPTLDPIGNLSLNQGAGQQTVNLTGISFGPTNENQVLVVSATSSNPSLIPNPQVNYTSPNAAGTLTFTPQSSTNATATITVTVNDGQATNNLVSRSFTVSVNAIPAISSMADQVTSEDTPTAAIFFQVSDVETPATNLVVSVSSSNPSLVPTNNIVLSGSGTNRSLVAAPVFNQSGSAIITLSVRDADGNFASTSFVLTVNAVNDAPTLDAIGNLVLNEDAGVQTVNLSGITSGAANEAQTLSVTATSSQPSIIPNPSVTYTSPGATGSLSFTPVANASGTAVITVSVNDGGSSNNLVTRTFTVTVNAVNDAPIISAVVDQVILEDASTGPLVITIADLETPATNLLLSGRSSNPALLPDANIVFGGSGTNRTVTLTPATNQFGITTITIAVTDPNGGSNSTSFLLTVRAVNDAPTLDLIGNLTLDEDAGAQIIGLTGISSGAANEAQTLSVTATSSQPSIIPNPSVSYASPNATGSLSFTPVANANGTAIITVSVNDGGSSNNLVTRTFTVTVNAVNDPPVISGIVDQSTDEDVPTAAIAFTIGDLETPATNLLLSGRSSNPALLPDANIVFGGSGTNRTVTLTPATNQFGTAVISLVVADGDGAQTTNRFLLTVRPVNDLPIISQIAAQATPEDAPVGPVAFTIGDVETAAEALGLSGRSSNLTLVPNANIIFGGSGSNRTVTVTPAPDQFGSAIITLTVSDLDGGSNTTSFVLTVSAVNDLPSISVITNQVTAEDAAKVISFTVGDVETAAGNLILSGISSNSALVPNENIIFGGSGSNRTVTLIPTTNQFGSTVITITVADGDGGSNSTSFVLTVNAVNDPPVISGVSNQVIARDKSSADILIRIGDTETPAENLVLSGHSSNPTLVPNANIIFGGSGSNRTFKIVPAANQFGTATITLIVADESGGTASTSFVLSVMAVTRGPYLQQGTPNSILVRWRTDSATDSRVLYGTNLANLNLAAVTPDSTTEHVIRLTGLTPDTAYFYAVGASAAELARGPGYFFMTAPTNSKPTRIWVIGDAGLKTTNQLKVRDAYYSAAINRYTDVWLQLGDNAYDNGTDAEYQEAVFDIYPRMLRQTVTWPTIGNHEFYSAVSYQQFDYLDIFSPPTAGEAGGVPSGSKKYYSFDYGNIHFVCLDSMTSDRAVGGPMLRWLETDLAANTKDWLIAFWHHPPYSKGTHDSDYESELMDMRVNAVPILEAYGVDLVLSGHSHSYERSYFLDGHYGTSDTLVPNMKLDSGSGRREETGPYMKSGVGPLSHQGAVYMVAGSSGETVAGDLNHPAMFLSLNELGSVVLDVNGQILEAKFLRDDGVVADHFTIAKGIPHEFRVMKLNLSPGFIEVTWNSKPGIVYRVEYASNLNAVEWLDRSGPLRAVGTTMRWKGLIDPVKSAGYYRVVTLGN